MKSSSSFQSLVLGLAIIALCFFGYQYHSVKKDLSARLADADHSIGELRQALESKTRQNADIISTLESEQRKNGDFAKAIGALEKLSKTDQELLQKYSKVYFLNENYVPSSLAPISKLLFFDQTRDIEFHANALPFLLNMIQAAKLDGLDPLIVSAYRSFNTQSGLKATYKQTYGSGANQFSADQGYSEHQLGTAVDFTTLVVGGNLTGFEKTKEYAWLLANAYKYGFVLSYPKNNTFYEFEPWHWRFVGVALATKLHNENNSFYDVDQREIDDYLVRIFD